MSNPPNNHGILLIDKPIEKSSFFLVYLLRKITGIQKIGHAGTLDPLATGIMVMLVGKTYTTKSDLFLNDDKEYEVVIELGKSTSTYDAEGEITAASEHIPSLKEIETAVESFQGDCLQVPPMFCAKKQGGKKLYELARKGVEIERPPQKVFLSTHLIEYQYPFVKLFVRCSKGTYIRSIAHDLGLQLGSFGYVKELRRVRSGSFKVSDALSLESITDKNFIYTDHLKRL
jgi:tRNA pseudouridine55 synthase